MAEFIRRLRKKGHKIKTEMVYDKDTGDTYGVYYLEPVKKVSRIKQAIDQKDRLKAGEKA